MHGGFAMAKKNLTIRVDDSLKTAAEQACQFLGCTLTSVVHKALNEVIIEANQLAKNYNEVHENLSEAMTARFYLSAASREVQVLKSLGYQPPTNISLLTQVQLHEYLSGVMNAMDTELFAKQDGNDGDKDD